MCVHLCICVCVYECVYVVPTTSSKFNTNWPKQKTELNVQQKQKKLQKTNITVKQQNTGLQVQITKMSLGKKFNLILWFVQDFPYFSQI